MKNEIHILASKLVNNNETNIDMGHNTCETSWDKENNFTS